MASSPQFIITNDIKDEDYRVFAQLEHDAFTGTNNPIIALLFPPPPPPEDPNSPPVDPLARRTDGLREQTKTDPSLYHEKAVIPETGEIIGWATWNLYVPPNAAPKELTEFMAPPVENKALGKHFFTGMFDARSKVMGDRPHYHMQVLVVSPAHQRKGVGKALLESKLAEADEKGFDCWIDASPEGLGLYKKVGWEEVARLDTNLGDFGGKEGEVDTVVHLVRKPVGKGQ